jgi:hypothetical protein
VIALFADGFDDAILGMAGDRVVYDTAKIIEILHTEHDMTEEEAVEYYEYNILGAYMGEGTPLYLEHMTKEEIERLYSE